MNPLTKDADYTIVNDNGSVGASVSEIQPLFFKPGKSGWSTFELIRAFGNRGENVPGLNANTDGAYAIGTERNTGSTSSRFVAALIPRLPPSSGRCSPALRTPSPSRCTPL